MEEYKRCAKTFALEIYQDFLRDCKGENLKERSIDESIKEVRLFIENIDKIKFILPNIWFKEYTFYIIALDYLYKMKQ